MHESAGAAERRSRRSEDGARQGESDEGMDENGRAAIAKDADENPRYGNVRDQHGGVAATAAEQREIAASSVEAEGSHDGDEDEGYAQSVEEQRESRDEGGEATRQLRSTVVT